MNVGEEVLLRPPLPVDVLNMSLDASDIPTNLWKVTDLKNFLRKHGALLSGKKVELLER